MEPQNLSVWALLLTIRHLLLQVSMFIDRLKNSLEAISVLRGSRR
ncbi:hypothetical protein XBKB1_530030 [Xenorhabdus bovienii str. kraussei Becker Underwood]|uniref:Uncharacterized protein n=1 Tax=Xenorhabdus bovienii str. kraussei Becker Underwood TaxID=1398204 RepID=A0A077PYF7_XENBV|nr:hypothetical protein XBKB1_530030 [Xenorhabdus bovienii str. kraussei Becker Underwood]